MDDILVYGFDAKEVSGCIKTCYLTLFLQILNAKVIQTPDFGPQVVGTSTVLPENSVFSGDVYDQISFRKKLK